MTYHENLHYFKHLQPYLVKHHRQIEEKRDEVKKKIGGVALQKAYFVCDCGETVRLCSFRPHFASKKHRKVCGDLSDCD